VISVTSNVAPAAMVALHDAAGANDWDTVRHWQDRLIKLHKALFLDNSPAPTKYALAKSGLCEEGVRLPLAPCAESVRPLIDDALREAGAF
jgi:4-hydroxy-tetrahydrodipicolinate synthase